MFFEQFQKRCKELKTSPTAITLKIGLTKSNVTNWKNGAMPNGDVLQKLAKELDCSTDYLLGNTDDPTPADKKKASPDEIEAELRRILDKIPDKDITPEKADLIVRLWQDIVDSVVDEK